MEVSVWLIPSDKDKEDLLFMINSLSEQFRSPVFIPHVTLLQPFEVESLDSFYNFSDQMDHTC